MIGDTPVDIWVYLQTGEGDEGSYIAANIASFGLLGFLPVRASEEHFIVFANGEVISWDIVPSTLPTQTFGSPSPGHRTSPDRQQETGGSKPAASGTGFVISRQGHVLTNHHVIEGCAMIRTPIEGRQEFLSILRSDAQNDLALLKLSSPGVPHTAIFREGRSIRPGESVVAMGFPLHGLLSAEANITTGNVSALAGIGNDTRFLQITAPVQPGNSGGPLLDQSGNVAGVVVSKLDAIKIAKHTGDVPQNVNFAINTVVVLAFLDANTVDYSTAPSTKKLDHADIGEQAKKFTLLLECLK